MMCTLITVYTVGCSLVETEKDLINNRWPSSLFCVTLRAKDTNRITSVATVMQMLSAEDRSIRNHDKVVVTCKAVGIADIVSVDNPQAWEYGKVGGEYLIANVKIRSHSELIEDEHINNDEMEEAKKLLSDYERVKGIYSNSHGISSNELPPYSRDAIQTAMSNFTVSDIINDIKFWKFIETWQMLCNSIRQAKCNQLSSMINEISVEAAMELDGPLELPVKRMKLPESVQWKLHEMEQRYSRDFLKMGMDPVINFQMLMEMTNHWDRVAIVSRMVKSELDRLEAKESLIKAFLHKGQQFSSDGFL